MQILLKKTSPIEVEAVVRSVPQHREVIRGSWQGQLVYAKQFIGNRAKKHFERDVAGIQKLVDANIATPALLFKGLADASNTYVAIYSAVVAAKNVEDAYEQLATDERFLLMKKLVQTVAQHHKAGLIQTDIYFKNFLVKNDEITNKLNIYTLDGDGIRALSKFSKRYQQQNLATLFSKMDVLDEDAWLQDLYQVYCTAMDVPLSVNLMTKVFTATQKIRHQVANGYAEKKVFRNCTDVKIKRSFKIFHAQTADFVIEDLVPESLDALLAKSKYNIKNGNTCSISKAEVAKKNVVIKRYNVKSFWHGVNRFFRCSRAARSWANAHRLIISNIATAKPLALIEERWGWFRRRAYYLSEYIDAPDVMQFFTQSSNLQEQQVVASNLANLFYKLYLLKFSHGDCKATNIKIVNLAPVLIDLDGLQAHFGRVFGNWWFERKHIKDLKRLMKNWANDANVTTLLKQAFILQYATQQSNENNGILLRAGLV